jgi:hypothetical protein
VGVVVGMAMAVVMMIVVMVIVAAIRPMHMRLGADALMVAVPMMRIAVMGMIMRTMLVVVMIVAMLMPVHRSGRDIGAALGVERRFDLDHGGAEPPRHILDDMVAADAQAFLQKLGRQMTITQMPGDAHERRGVRAANFRQFFRRGDDFDDPPVVQRQTVAGTQHHRLGQIEQKGEAAHAGHRDAAPIAVVIIENDRVGRFAGPGAGGTNGMSVLHSLAKVWRRGFWSRCRSLPYAPWAL